MIEDCFENKFDELTSKLRRVFLPQNISSATKEDEEIKHYNLITIITGVGVTV